MTAVEKIQKEFTAATLDFRADWQWNVSLGKSFAEMRDGTVVDRNAAFISYGVIEADPEGVMVDGRCLKYRRTVDLYVVFDGDLSAIVDAYLSHMNGEGDTNSFVDASGETRTITIEYCSPRTTAYAAFEITHRIN